MRKLEMIYIENGKVTFVRSGIVDKTYKPSFSSIRRVLSALQDAIMDYEAELIVDMEYPNKDLIVKYDFG
jgi:hypothetical protein